MGHASAQEFWVRIPEKQNTFLLDRPNNVCLMYYLLLLSYTIYYFKTKQCVIYI